MNNIVCALAAVAAAGRAGAGWYVGELSTHQTLLVAGMILVAATGAPLWAAIAGSAAFLAARQAGALDIDPLIFTPAVTAQGIAVSGGLLVVLWRAPHLLPIGIVGGSLYLLADTATLLEIT